MEAAFLRWLRDRLSGQPVLPVGFGDDAAVLRFDPPGDCVVTTDMLTEGVDFRLAQTDAALVGRKALAVNLSDLAAMAAVPVAAVVSLALPRSPRRGALELAQQLYEGLLLLAAEFDVVIAGGDTNTHDGGLVISVTALGRPTALGPLLRSGARVGDELLVTGTLGGSILGRHLTFTPRVREALALHDRYELHACIDISDGLSLDLSRLAAASGTGAAIEVGTLPISEAACDLASQRNDGISPLEHALSDGEDFELLMAVPPHEAERIVAEKVLTVPISRIGRIVAQPGLWQIEGETLVPLAPRGWEH